MKFVALSHLILLIGVALCLVGCSAAGRTATTAPSKANTPKFGLVEISLQSTQPLANPFWDAAAVGRFTSPSGKVVSVEGFYDGDGTWRIRFVPREEGRWTCRATLSVNGKTLDQQKHEFVCQGASGHGFIQVSKVNPYRWQYEDGTPFYPIGIQTCNFLRPDFDGPDAEGKWRTTTTEQWLKEFKGAVNLVRTQFGQGTTSGCAFALIPEPPRAPKGSATRPATKPAQPPAPIPLDRYDLELARKLDDTYLQHRAAGMSQILIFFQDMSLFGDPDGAFGRGRDQKNNKCLTAANLPLQEKYIRYIVARYGAFVDVWELYNEDVYAPEDYLAHLAGVVRKADPYGHPITSNLWRQQSTWADVITWHEYMGMPANQVDAHLAAQAALWKSYGKLVQNTEFGNQGQLANVDPVKWRIAVWTAYMNEMHLLFWGMSGRERPATPVGQKPPAGNANAYIGADSRQHFRVLNDFTRDMPVDMRPVFSGFTRHGDIRHYALSNGQVTALYVHHFADHSKPYAADLEFWVNTGPGTFNVRWISPEDGKEVATERTSTASAYLKIKLPPVTVDLAARIDRVGP